MAVCTAEQSDSPERLSERGHAHPHPHHPKSASSRPPRKLSSSRPGSGGERAGHNPSELSPCHQALRPLHLQLEISRQHLSLPGYLRAKATAMLLWELSGV